MTDSAEHAITLEIDLVAPVGRVWTALTTSYGLRAWWWAQWEDVTVSVDARPAGEYRLTADAAGIRVEGVYTEVDRPAGRLAFTWVWSDSGGTSEGETCEIVLSPLPEGTRLTLRHAGPWTSTKPGERYRAGWSDQLEQLRAAVTRTR